MPRAWPVPGGALGDDAARADAAAKVVADAVGAAAAAAAAASTKADVAARAEALLAARRCVPAASPLPGVSRGAIEAEEAAFASALRSAREAAEADERLFPCGPGGAQAFARLAAGDSAALVADLAAGEVSVDAAERAGGRTLLMNAARAGNAAVIAALLAAGAAPGKVAADGTTALHCVFDAAAEWPVSTKARADATARAARCLRALLQGGADARAADANGATPLHTAAALGLPVCVQLLLEAGAEPTAARKDGLTPARALAESVRCRSATDAAAVSALLALDWPRLRRESAARALRRARSAADSSADVATAALRRHVEADARAAVAGDGGGRSGWRAVCTGVGNRGHGTGNFDEAAASASEIIARWTLLQNWTSHRAAYGAAGGAALPPKPVREAEYVAKTGLIRLLLQPEDRLRLGGAATATRATAARAATTRRATRSAGGANAGEPADLLDNASIDGVVEETDFDGSVSRRRMLQLRASADERSCRNGGVAEAAGSSHSDGIDYMAICRARERRKAAVRYWQAVRLAGGEPSGAASSTDARAVSSRAQRLATVARQILADTPCAAYRAAYSHVVDGEVVTRRPALQSAALRAARVRLPFAQCSAAATISLSAIQRAVVGDGASTDALAWPSQFDNDGAE